MPIHLPLGLRRLGDGEFRQVAYGVVQIAFAVHNEMGGLFDELLYRQATAQRIPRAETQVTLGVSFESFRKNYYLDLLVAHGAVFELKAAERISDRHRAQLLNYLLLAELPHGKLVNFGDDSVEHEFVNAPLSRHDRISFQVNAKDYVKMQDCSIDLKELLVTILRDWGTCLDVALYNEAVAHFLGGQQQVDCPIDICMNGKIIGQQKMNLITPETSIYITTLNEDLIRYEGQLRRFLKHTVLKAIQWVNIGRKLVTLHTIKN
jgi:GxxExxY protein